MKSKSKVVNPQRILEAKKALLRKAGGKMAWGGKVWTVRKGKKETELTSRQMASYSVEKFAKAFHLAA